MTYQGLFSGKYKKISLLSAVFAQNVVMIEQFCC